VCLICGQAQTFGSSQTQATFGSSVQPDVRRLIQIIQNPTVIENSNTMKTPLLTAIVSITFTLLTAPAHGQIRSFDASHLRDRLDRLHEIDFENLPESSLFSPPLPNPLTIAGVTFQNPVQLRTGFCSSPTCTPDPDNSDGGNIQLFLHPGATMSFAAAPRLVVLDIQGIGDNPFELVVTDGRGHKRRVSAQGILFGQSLLGLFSSRGIRKIELARVGGTGGALALARVLFYE
jgi:hypothetical protein